MFRLSLTVWKEFCFFDKLYYKLQVKLCCKYCLWHPQTGDSLRLNMNFANMLRLVLAFCTICTVAFAKSSGEKLSYEEILRAVKAGEIQDSGPTSPVKTKFEHVLDGSKFIDMFWSQRNVCPEFTLKVNIPNVSISGIIILLRLVYFMLYKTTINRKFAKFVTNGLF